MLGTIRVRNLEFQANHGASAAERRSSRRFQVDVDMTFPVGRALETDRLTETVNYHDVCALVIETGTQTTYRLIEALAGAMLRELRARWPQASVELELRKLHPPCPGNPDYTSIHLSSDRTPAAKD
jgi:dihydroneopterin aldolase